MSGRDNLGDSDLLCPFCKEVDFDLIGLKNHLQHGDCNVFNDLPRLRTICEISNSVNTLGGEDERVS